MNNIFTQLFAAETQHKGYVLCLLMCHEKVVPQHFTSLRKAMAAARKWLHENDAFDYEGISVRGPDDYEVVRVVNERWKTAWKPNRRGLFSYQKYSSALGWYVCDRNGNENW